MFKKAKYNTLYVVAVLALAQVVAADTINLQFKSNKVEYICGEPVLLKTTVLNLSSDDFVGNPQGYAWYVWSRKFGYSMYIAYDGSDFSDILNASTKSRLGVGVPPTNYEFFWDRYRLLKTLPAGHQAERFDMLIFTKPGNYKLKAVLKQRDGKIIYASKPIEFRILPLKEKYDSISQLGEQDFAINLGSLILYAHYVEQLWGGRSPGKSLYPKDFNKVSPVIRENYKDSVFREYVMYADIMSNGGSYRGGRKLTKQPQELAERFVKEYPKSWLLPEVCRKLFWTYVAAGDKEKAEAARNKALQIAPHATVLRHIRKSDLSKIKPPQ